MKCLVSNNEFLKGIVYKTKNIAIQEIQKGDRRERCYIIGNGHSMNLNDNNYVVKHDPFMHKFEPKIHKRCTVYAFYFTFECSGLEESSQEIAKFVNDLQDTYDEVVFVGHSKCGLCLANASYYCKKEIVLVTISTPFLGTVIADKKKSEEILKFPFFIKIYNKIFSDHNVDKDIAPGSIFIKNMHKPVCKYHINIISSLDKITHCRNIVDVFLLFLDKYMKIDGDGVVPLSSQKAILNNKTISIFGSHQSSLKEGLKIIDRLQ